jgi:LysR family glycine cleavage system transcriptional activator
MFDQLPPLKSLRAFEAAARLGSFTLAAKELSITQGAISYQVRRLETSLDVSLFQRSVRQITLTTAGQSLYRTTHRLFRELEDEIHSIAPRQQPLLLTVSVSTFFVTRWLSPRLGHFLNEQPRLTLRLQHSVNDPDFTVEDVDLAIRWGKGNWLGVESELLIPSPMMALCAPQLARGANPVNRLEDLRQHTFLHDQTGNDGWLEWLALAGLEDLGSGKGPVIIDPNVRVQSAIDGHGLVMANRLLVDDIKQGRLMEPFDIRLEGYGFYLVYSTEAKRRKAFQLFRSWVKVEAAAFLIPTDVLAGNIE